MAGLADAENEEKITRCLKALHAILAVDFSNAYGNFYRSFAILEAMEYIPKLLGIIVAAYASPTPVWILKEGEWMLFHTSREVSRASDW